MNLNNWNEIKNNLKAKWSQLSLEEITKTGGNEILLQELLEKRCGLSKGEARDDLAKILQPEPETSLQKEAHTIMPDDPGEPNEIYTENLPPETKLT